MMYTSQLVEALEKNPLTAPVFAGVLSADETPTKPPPPHESKRVYIINTQPSTKPGQHWVGLYFAPTGVVYYFDSYGLRPFSNIKKKLAAFKRIQPWNRRVQGWGTTCGMYCLCFVLSIVGAFDFNIFGDDLSFNDRVVRNVVLNRFRWSEK